MPPTGIETHETDHTLTEPDPPSGSFSRAFPRWSALAQYWSLGDSPGLRLWRNKILNAVLGVMLILAVLAYVPSVVIAMKYGKHAIIFWDTLALAAIICLFLASHLPFQVRAGGLLVVCFLVGIYFTWGFGPLAAGPLWLFATPVLAAILFGLPGAMLTLAATTVSLIVFGISLSLGLVGWHEAITTAMWIVMSGSFLTLSGLLSVSVAVLLGGIVDVHAKFEQEVEARKKDSLQIEEGSRLEALGRLAGGVAHDFNNILTAILGYTDVLKSKLKEQGEAVAYLDGITESANRAAALTRQLLAFSRQQEVESSRIDMNVLLTTMESMLRRVIRENVALEIVPAKDAWQAFGDRTQLESVVLNLVINAVDAIPVQGTVTISTANRIIDEDDAMSRSIGPGSYLMVAVADDGIGMSDEIQAHVFEPFFTTKEFGSGTGLGLTSAHGIVVKCGGGIFVESAAGLGTTFSVFLPRAPESAPDDLAEASASARTHGDEEILIVEDDSSIRNLLVHSLTPLGYTVHPAADAQEAVAIADERGGTIRLLLTDVIMPEISGPALVRLLEPRLPNACILYMSGYTGDVLDRHGVESAASTLIQKPFTTDELAGRVRQILDRDTASVKPNGATYS